MRAAISGRDRRALLIGAVVIGAGLFFGRGLPSYRARVDDARASAQERADQLQRVRALTAKLPDMRDSASARNERIVTLAPLLVGTGSRGAAGAALASLVSGAAVRAGMEIGTVRIATDSMRSGPFVRVRIHADAAGDLPRLMRMLKLLESGREMLVIPSFTITQPLAGGPADQPEALQLELTVDGLALLEGDSPARPGETLREKDGR